MTSTGEEDDISSKHCLPFLLDNSTKSADPLIYYLYTKVVWAMKHDICTKSPKIKLYIVTSTGEEDDISSKHCLPFFNSLSEHGKQVTTSLDA